MAEGSDRVTRISFHDETLVLGLADGCMLTVPLAWFPRLRDASPEERGNWSVGGTGDTVHWPALDQVINVALLLRRRPLAGADLLR